MDSNTMTCDDALFQASGYFIHWFVTVQQKRCCVRKESTGKPVLTDTRDNRTLAHNGQILKERNFSFINSLKLYNGPCLLRTMDTFSIPNAYESLQNDLTDSEMNVIVYFANIIISQLSLPVCVGITETDRSIIGQLSLHICIQVGNLC